MRSIRSNHKSAKNNIMVTFLIEIVFGLSVEEDELKRNSIVQIKNGDYVVQKIIIEITFILKKNEGYI